jgi:hypothetical protein
VAQDQALHQAPNWQDSSPSRQKAPGEKGNEMPHGHPWYNAFDDPTDRFLAIMQNIIRNKGTFVLTDLPA